MLSMGGMGEGCFWLSRKFEWGSDKDKNKGWMKEVDFKHL